MYQEGLVSVIIPTYKRADKLLRAVNSVSQQTYENLQILIVNDNEKNDKYSQELYSLKATIKDKRVVLIEQEKHINGAAARNAGIKAATGEFIAFLDDDDVWVPTKIEHQIKELSILGKEYGGVSTLFYSFLDDDVILESIPYKDGFIWEDILCRRCDVTTCSVLLRHSALDDTGYFDESLSRHQEIQLLSFFCKKYKIYLLKEYLLYVDAWGENNPKPERMIKIKQDFFNAVKPLTSDMPKGHIRTMYALHKFEIAYVYFTAHQYMKSLKYLMPLLINLRAMYLAFEKVVIRMKSKNKARHDKLRVFWS